MADMSVYMINSLQGINNTLAFYEFGVDSRLEMIQGNIHNYSSNLLDSFFGFIKKQKKNVQ